MNIRHHQTGMTAIGWLLIMALIAFLTLITLRTLPLYLEFAKVSSVLESLAEEPDVRQLSKGEIVKIVRKRFDVNDVQNVDPKLIKVSKDGRSMKVGINYERRKHLIGNVDIVTIFDKEIEVAAN